MQRRIPAHFVDVIDKAAHAVAGKIERVGNLFLSVEPCLNRQRPLFGSFIPTRHAVDVEFGNAAHGRSRIQKTRTEAVLDDGAVFDEVVLPFLVCLVYRLKICVRVKFPFVAVEDFLSPLGSCAFGGFCLESLKVTKFGAGAAPKDDGGGFFVDVGDVFVFVR